MDRRDAGGRARRERAPLLLIAPAVLALLFLLLPLAGLLLRAPWADAADAVSYTHLTLPTNREV